MCLPRLNWARSLETTSPVHRLCPVCMTSRSRSYSETKARHPPLPPQSAGAQHGGIQPLGRRALIPIQLGLDQSGQRVSAARSPPRSFARCLGGTVIVAQPSQRLGSALVRALPRGSRREQPCMLQLDLAAPHHRIAHRLIQQPCLHHTAMRIMGSCQPTTAYARRNVAFHVRWQPRQRDLRLPDRSWFLSTRRPTILDRPPCSHVITCLAPTTLSSVQASAHRSMILRCFIMTIGGPARDSTAALSPDHGLNGCSGGAASRPCPPSAKATDARHTGVPALTTAGPPSKEAEADTVPQAAGR